MRASEIAQSTIADELAFYEMPIAKRVAVTRVILSWCIIRKPLDRDAYIDIETLDMKIREYP